MNRTPIAMVGVLCAGLLIVACQAAELSVAPATPSPSAPVASQSLAATTVPVVTTLPPPTPTAVPTDSAIPTVVPRATYAPIAAPSVAPFAPGAPAIPSSPSLAESADPSADWRVTWQAASPDGVTVQIYAVTSCLHTPTPSTPDVTCMVNGDMIPRADLLFLGSVPASAGTFSFAVGEGVSNGLGSLPGNGPTVFAVVIQAVNAQRGSLFAIAGSSGLCFGCTV